MISPTSALDLAHGVADEWKEKVQTNAEWNHIPKFEELLSITSPDKLDANHYFQRPGTNRLVLYDVWSNIHYSYVGHVCAYPHQAPHPRCHARHG